MKSNLKEQVAELQKDSNDQFKRIETLRDKIENYLVPRLQKMDKELVDLKAKIGNTNVGATLDSDAQRISELEKRVEDLHTRLNILTLHTNGSISSQISELEKRVKQLDGEAK